VNKILLLIFQKVLLMFKANRCPYIISVLIEWVGVLMRRDS